MYYYEIEVHGMMCGMCESHIAETIRKNFTSAEKTKASRRKNLLSFRSKEPISEEDLRKALQPTGYEVGVISIEEK